MNDNINIIRFDWAAKRILRDKANFGVLEGLLTVLIGQQIAYSNFWKVNRIKRTRMRNTIV